MSETWIKWEPIAGLEEKYYIESVCDSSNGLKIVLIEAHDDQKKVYVTFKDSVDSYIRTDESFKLNIIYDLDKKYGTRFYAGWTFFKVTNSSYVKQLLDQAHATASARSFMHFSFFAIDSVLDVIAEYTPEVSLIMKSGDH